MQLNRKITDTKGKTLQRRTRFITPNINVSVEQETLTYLHYKNLLLQQFREKHNSSAGP